MKINSLKLNNNPNFCGQRLFSAKLLNYAENKTLDCFISQMDKSDLLLAERTQNKWVTTKYGWAILDDFIDFFSNVKSGLGKSFFNYKFFMVEDPKEKVLANKIKAIAEVCEYPKLMTLDYLQSATELKNTPAQYSGAGGCLLYAIANIAKRAQKVAVMCVPDANVRNFYRKHFFCRDMRNAGSAWLLRSSDFSIMQNMLAKKYCISPLSKLENVK